MPFFLYNSGCTQYFLPIFSMISYFDKLLQMTIQSLVKQSLLCCNFGLMREFWAKNGIVCVQMKACSIFSKYFLHDFIFWLAFANDNAKFSKTVFIVLKFCVSEANLDHKLHFLCITQVLLKIL